MNKEPQSIKEELASVPPGLEAELDAPGRIHGEARGGSDERTPPVLDDTTEYAILSLDVERRVTSLSVGARRLLGESATRIVGRRCDEALATDERRGEAAAAPAGGRENDDDPSPRRNGEHVGAGGVMVPMRDQRGEVVGFVDILRDRTAERRDRDELARSRADLVEALSRNEQACSQLQAAALAKDRFLAVLSHELRNPLASIANAVDALQAASRLTPVDRGRAQLTLRSQVEAMRTLLDDLLDLSRLRFGRLVLKKHGVTLRSVVDSALETARALADKRRHALTVRLPDEEIMLDVDPGRMSQVLSNLLINAAKYTDEGGRIELRAGVQGDACRIEVADNGKGLDDAARRSMFEMFWCAGEVDAGCAQGMGIGLAVARSVVQMHGGSITAESAGPGQGSTIVITLPLGRPGPSAPAEAADAPCPARPRVAQRRRVVVADDIEDVAWALAAALQAWGHDLGTVSDGAGLLALVERERPDVAIVDLGMPGLSGYEVARRLRSTPHGRDMLLVAVTGWGGDADRERSMQAGFDAHLIKPVPAATLCALIDAWKA